MRAEHTPAVWEGTLKHCGLTVKNVVSQGRRKLRLDTFRGKIKEAERLPAGKQAEQKKDRQGGKQ